MKNSVKLLSQSDQATFQNATKSVTYNSLCLETAKAYFLLRVFIWKQQKLLFYLEGRKRNENEGKLWKRKEKEKEGKGRKRNEKEGEERKRKVSCRVL